MYRTPIAMYRTPVFQHHDFPSPDATLDRASGVTVYHTATGGGCISLVGTYTRSPSLYKATSRSVTNGVHYAAVMAEA
jgi:hypothetical protein